jgi:hypothetical protein
MRVASLLLSLAVLPVACNTDNSPPVGNSLVVSLVTADDVVVGKATVANSESTLMVTVATDDGWTLQKVRMALGTQLSSIPQTRHGEPITGRFPLRKTPAKNSSEVSWRLPLIVDPGTVLFFAIQAEVKKKESKDDDDKCKDDDCDHDKDKHGSCKVDFAWGQGTPFPKLKGSMYFTYTVQSPLPPTLAGLYRTHTQEEWGGDPAVDAAAAYLATNFTAAFPTGVTIGVSGGFTARFTAVAGVARFLPQVGPPAPIGGIFTNPPSLANAFAGNTLALALNVAFDARDDEFAPGVQPLGELVVADPRSPCFGLTVADVLSRANRVLSGDLTVEFTADQMNDCVLKINLNFQGGTIDQGYVGLP